MKERKVWCLLALVHKIGLTELAGQTDATKSHGFAIALALIGDLQSLRSFRRRLP